MTVQFLQVANNASSSLAQAVGAQENGIQLPAGGHATFPAPPFDITIDKEILHVTAVIGDFFTVTRAAQGTVAAEHGNGAEIDLNVTAKSITDLNKAVNTLEVAPEWSEVEQKHPKLEYLGAPYSRPQVRLTSPGLVQMRGGVQVKAGETIAGGEALLKVPAAFHPSEEIHLCLVWVKEGGALLVTTAEVGLAGEVSVSELMKGLSRVYLNGAVFSLV